MRTHNWRQTGRGRIALAVCLAAAALAMGGCESNGDPTAPADSTLTVSADPQTVIPGEKSTITATLRSKTGARLPDQEVTFSTTEGTLDPPAETALTTDSQGQASSVLITPGTATVTAQSGSISGSTQVQTSSCKISTVGVNVNPDFIEACDATGKVEVIATVLDTSGNPCVAVLVDFTNPASTVTGTFRPSQPPTNALGEAISEWTVNSTQCEQQCGSNPSDPSAGNCTIFIGASVGTIKATPEQITDNVP